MSKVIVGLILVLVASLARVFKWQYAEDDIRDVVEQAVTFAGVVFAWWGRKRSTGEPINWTGVKVAPVLLVLLLTSCVSVDKIALQDHAAAVADIAAENTKYIQADPTLADSQKAIRVQVNKDTAAFAKNLAEAK